MKANTGRRYKLHQELHGASHTRTYRIWAGVLSRCRNPLDKAWVRYGGRGISVCQRWYEYSNFLSDMGERPGNLEIERIDNDGNYEPSNCRWATDKEQSRNKRTTFLVSVFGRQQSAAAWAEEFGIKRVTFYSRLSRGYSPEQALTEPVGSYARRSNWYKSNPRMIPAGAVKSPEAVH